MKKGFTVKKVYNYDFIDLKTNSPIFWGDEISISYTLKCDNIRGGRIATNTPYESRRGNLLMEKETEHGFVLANKSLKTKLSVEIKNDIMYLDLINTDYTEFTQFGLNLPFNFMGKLGGGDCRDQYLFNSPYRSANEEYKYCYLKSHNSQDIFVVFLSPADGWKMDYSPWVGGHYFYNLQCLANFDVLYGTGSERKGLKLAIFTADDYMDGLQKMSKLLGVPVLSYEKSYTFDGCGELTVYGDCDKVEMINGNGGRRCFVPSGNTVKYDGAARKTLFVPYFQGKAGLDCSVWCYEDLIEDFEKSNDAIVAYTGEPNFGNLCECQFWAAAMLRYIQRYGEKPSYHKRLKEFFDVLLAEDENKAVERLSVLEKPYGEFPKYSVFKSRRIQEHMAGVTILLDAYQVYKDEKYLTYALGMLDSLIENYQKPNGGFFTGHGGYEEDYSTVTCLILPLVDMANFFKGKDGVLSKKYADSAKALAEHIYQRGFHFPTEGGDSGSAEEQMEDGSISCSALSLLYYAANVQREEKYIRLAKEILDFHEGWVMNTPDANVYRSSLRWWETRWEGDKDGPALCCGHGWTIWRAEADFWYYKLTGDKEYLHKALSSFTTNFAKFAKDGKATAVYQMDYITGGGFQYPKMEIPYRIAPRFPDKEDVKTSRYVWVRAYNTILTLSKEELSL